MSSSLRTCIGCRAKAPADALVRVVLREDGVLVTGPRGGSRGRGASLHRSEACVKAALSSGAFQRAFRGRRPVDDPATVAALVLSCNSNTVGNVGPNLPGSRGR